MESETKVYRRRSYPSLHGAGRNSPRLLTRSCLYISKNAEEYILFTNIHLQSSVPMQPKAGFRKVQNPCASLPPEVREAGTACFWAGGHGWAGAAPGSAELFWQWSHGR